MAAALGQQKPAASVLQSFPFRAAMLALCVALLPLLPAQAPEGLAAAGVGQAFLAKAWELVHLLVVGIAVSYGLFSRRNDTAGDGRPEKEESGKPADARYVSRMFRDSLAPFDDDEEDVVFPGSPVAAGGGREDEGGGGGNVRSWSAMHRADEPVVVVTNGRGHDTFQLPVRTLKPQPARRGPHQDPAARGPEETVLPSPIPWRSRSGRFDAARPASPSPSSPKRLSPASSSSRETLAKATEEYYGKRVRSPPRRSSSTTTPPAPPPPPPPFLVHGYHPAAERRTAKSFKEELQDHSVRSRRGDDRFPPNRRGSFNTGATAGANSSAPAKPRSSFDSGGGSAYSTTASVIGKSVRTFRAREPPVFHGPSQEVPEEDADDVRRDDAAQEAAVHGSEEELYGYRGYQSIPRFQYERSVSDPILGGVAVSSDETESSDDDEDGGAAYSTRETTPEVDENEVDKKAEEFIARFREQIRRQRIESIKRSAGPRGVKHATK